MEPRSIITGIILGIIIGASLGFTITPPSNTSELEKQIVELEQLTNTFKTSLEISSSQTQRLEEQIKTLQSQVASQELSLLAVSFQTIHLMVMLISQEDLVDTLINAHIRGVDVFIVIDDEWMFSPNSGYLEMASAGIDIRGDDRNGTMHHKALIIDGNVVVTGSYNWSPSAEENNDENIIILKSSTIAEIYLQEFERLWNYTKRYDSISKVYGTR
jgi:phosphatidylserine/phosphatidylglycerophosphate/cardiolipin synthase-like enzyme